MIKYEIEGKDVYLFTDGTQNSAVLEWEDYLYVIAGELPEEEILELMKSLIKKI